jgi:ssDNA-binding Zn-finger/Zn-ribbon topoisomerase 1
MPEDTPKPKDCPDCHHPAQIIHVDSGHYVCCSNDWSCETRPTTRAHPNQEAAITAWNHDETH